MKRFILIIFLLSLSLTVVSFENTQAAVMSDYCQIPPYVVENQQPNIMMVVDNSGSMFNFAYFDGYSTETTADDNLCANVNSPCTGFTDPGTYPDFKYYGYFNPDYWYDYDSNRFIPTAPKSGTGLPGERAKAANEWDGNFLNWVTMRRIDIIRKALTGGKKGTGEGVGYSRLNGENADCDARGRFKEITDAPLYTPVVANETRCLRVNTAAAPCVGGGSSSTPSFHISEGSSCTSTFNDEYTIAVRVADPVDGVLQQVVGNRARIGLTFYHDNEPTPDGAKVRVSIAGGSLSSTVNEINNTRPTANTPLAETLWTIVGYFAQDATMEGGPGPEYNPGDYQINNNNDPFNYGRDIPEHCIADNYVLYLTDGEPCADGRLPVTIKSYANGKSNYDCSDLIPGDPGTDGFCPAVGSFPASLLPGCSGGGDPGGQGNVSGIEDVALFAHTNDLRGQDYGKSKLRGDQTLTLYTVYAFGKGSTILRYATINGAFQDTNANNIPDLQNEWDSDNDGEPDTFYEATDGKQIEEALRDAFENILKRAASGTAASVLASGEGQGASLIQAVFYPRTQLTGAGGIFGSQIGWIGRLTNYWYYVDPFFTLSSMREEEKATKDNILDLADDDIANLFFDNSQQLTLAAKCSDTNGDNICDGTTDIIAFENLGSIWEAGLKLWDMASTARTIKSWNDADDDGTVDTGELADFTAANAGHYFAGSSSTTITKNLFNLSAADDNLDGFLDDDLNRDGVVDETDAQILIEYVRGTDYTALYPWLRTKKTTIDLNGNGKIDQAELVGKIWKLGDIVSSTPRIASWQHLNSYDSRYEDATYTDYLGSAAYVDRGDMFAGANDGMLHSFKVGKLEFPTRVDQCSFTSGSQKACLSTEPDSTVDLGTERWAYVPRNALPYLKYLKEPTYCHIYTTDLSPFLFDASIGPKSSGDISDNAKTGDTNTWRTILIGGFRTGGACKNSTTACTVDLNGDKVIDGKDCVNTPIPDLGYSAYYAIDITDPLNPELLWEFAHEDLGFSTTGPAVVKISAKNDANGNSIQEGHEPPDNDKNGKWFVVFGSGSTGPIETTFHQFLGRSDQNLKLFVLDLKTGALASGSPIDTGIQYAYAGSLLNATHDTDLDYQDDVLYIPYTRMCETGSPVNDDDCEDETWTRGGILRLVTNEELNPANWEAPNVVIETLGPTTTAVKRLLDSNKDQMWLYAGTGRYYYKVFDLLDDKLGLRHFLGFKDVCYDPNNASANHQGFLTGADCSPLSFCSEPCSNPGTATPCTSPTSAGITGDCGDLENVTDITNVTTTPDDPTYKGWYINLDPAGQYTYFFTDYNLDPPAEIPLKQDFGAERIVADPVATPLGVVFHTSFKPYTGDCDLGGKTFVWATKYNTGGSVASLLEGIALIQVSTGSIEQIDLSEAFEENPSGDGNDPDNPINEDSKGDRRSAALEGVTTLGQDPLSIISTPPPLERTIHIREQ
jgi:type IV pilus assembly protein PilY1